MMSDVLTKQAFEVVGLPHNAEIPIDNIIKAILENKSKLKLEIALLLLMCCTEEESENEGIENVVS